MRETVAALAEVPALGAWTALAARAAVRDRTAGAASLDTVVD